MEERRKEGKKKGRNVSSKLAQDEGWKKESKKKRGRKQVDKEVKN